MFSYKQAKKYKALSEASKQTERQTQTNTQRAEAYKCTYEATPIVMKMLAVSNILISIDFGKNHVMSI